MALGSLTDSRRLAAEKDLDHGLEVESTPGPAPTDPVPRVPNEISDLFVAGLQSWIKSGARKPTVKYMKCRTFWPRLFVLILGENTAARLVQEDRFQEAIASLVVKMSDFLEDRDEIGLVCYADVPPYGLTPNRPVMAFALNMEEWRQKTLTERLTHLSQIHFNFTESSHNVGTALGLPIFQTMPRHRKITNAAGAVALVGLLGSAAGFVVHFANGGSAPLIVSAVGAIATWVAAEFGRDTFDSTPSESQG